MNTAVEFPFELRPPRRIERPEGSGTFVRLSEDIRRSVVYLGYRKPGTEYEITPVGTGFLLHMGVPDGGYLVTAGHVAKDLEDGAFDIRLNESYNLRKHGQKHSVARLQHI